MFGNNIKELRKEKGLTQTQLAQAVGVTQGAIYFWEKEINEPTVGYILKLAEFFQVSVDDLLSHTTLSANVSTKSAKMMAIFGSLSEKKQDLLISMAQEML